MVLFYVLLAAKTPGEVRHVAPAEAIVASMLKSYGGAESIKKIVSVTAKGRIDDFLNGKTGNYARYFESPGKLRIEVIPELGGEIRIPDGNRGWLGGSDGFLSV